MEGHLHARMKDCCLQREPYKASQESHCRQMKLVNCLMFQETVLQIGFQSETYCKNKQSSVNEH